MHELSYSGCRLQLLPEKAVYLPAEQTLLVADVHLGKSETFQARGVPIPNTVNQQTLGRLRSLCQAYNPKSLIVLGDLFHSAYALVDEVLTGWFSLVDSLNAEVTIIVGNHDRALIDTLKQHSICCCPRPVQLGSLLLSHEPHPAAGYFNLCGHVHPCLRLQTRLDRLRLPCFYLDRARNLLMLPSFGEFTGGYEIQLTTDTAAYAVADGMIVPFERPAADASAASSAKPAPKKGSRTARTVDAKPERQPSDRAGKTL